MASHSEFSSLTAGDIQKILRQRIIFVHGNPIDYDYDWDLESFGRSLLCPCYSCRNPVIPVESGGIQQNYFWQSPAKIAILGTIYSGGIEPFWNWDWNGPGMDRNGIQWNAVCINDKSTMHTPSGMFSSNRGVHRVLKMT